MENKITTHITKGIIISLIFIVYSLAGHLLNIEFESWYGWVAAALFITAIIISVNIYGKQLNNNVTFGNLFSHGFKTTAVVICITFLFTLLSVYVLFPDTIDKMMQKGVEQAINSGKMTSDQAEQSAPMMRKIITISVLAGSIFMNALLGAIASLIGAAITKKNPQDPFANQSI